MMTVRSPEPPALAKPRRGFFLQLITAALSALLGLVPAVLGALFFCDPLLRKRGGQGVAGVDPGKDADGFIRLDVALDSLPDDGTPVSCKVNDDKVDAWNKLSHVEIGTIWLRRIAEGPPLALSAICPHSGCAVDFRSGRNDYFCPCHTSAFDLDGRKLNDIPTRGMDRLETRLKPETGNAIWVKYQIFRAGAGEHRNVSGQGFR